MSIAVCVKQIPGPDAPQALDPESRTLVRLGDLVMDASDAHGVETALQVAEGTDELVVFVSMAPTGQFGGLRSALAMGGDSAILVSDDALAGCDALGTAKVLAAVIRRLDARLVICSTDSTDGYTGTVPVQVAELLGWDSISFATAVALQGEELHVRRQTERGFDEVSCPLPCVITVTAGSVEPRYPSLKGIMGARSKPIDEVDLPALGLETEDVIHTAKQQLIVAVNAAEARGAGEQIVDDGEAHQIIVDRLNTWKIL